MAGTSAQKPPSSASCTTTRSFMDPPPLSKEHRLLVGAEYLFHRRADLIEGGVGAGGVEQRLHHVGTGAAGFLQARERRVHLLLAAAGAHGGHPLALAALALLGHLQQRDR